jgi:hypothetical protein
MNKLFWKNLMRFEFFLVFFLVFLPGTQGNSNCPPTPAGGGHCRDLIPDQAETRRVRLAWRMRLCHNPRLSLRVYI